MNKTTARIFGLALLVGVTTAACTPARTDEATLQKLRKMAYEERHRLSAEADETAYCRYDEENKKMWWLRKAKLTDFVSKTGYDFQIVYDYLSPSSPAIAIKRADRITTSGSTVVALEQTRAGRVVGVSSDVKLDGSGLWAEGTAEFPPGTPVGTYFMYWLSDRIVCKHDNSPATRCKQLHFEFFASSLSKQRPDVGTTVIPDGPNSKCYDFGSLETDEGDGDEGLR